VVASGEEAIDLAEKSNPDLVLMDIGLDGRMDGIETANLIRRRFAIPVIYLTTNTDEQTLERARSTSVCIRVHPRLEEFSDGARVQHRLATDGHGYTRIKNAQVRVSSAHQAT